ncbi:hypothetical protein T265_06407 [Opisthorchis viverrini]|uniref:Uncharacterized protein n=1 Tax=Opisthorchis viverrini TaxID=6198 RepID=A0A075ADU5_OPIVI|nr:hypothetical protein T265_06407 [Opisthorchis viverrini]KER26284.1 hypothetical protein T265_06407 [Opisthorchis viverrini]
MCPQASPAHAPHKRLRTISAHSLATSSMAGKQDEVADSLSDVASCGGSNSQGSVLGPELFELHVNYLKGLEILSSTYAGGLGLVATSDVNHFRNDPEAL